MALFGPMFKGTSNLDSFLNGSINGFASDVSSIRKYAFYNCSGLKKVYLGNISSIGTNAFYNCLNLEEVDISGVASYFNLPASNIIPNNANLKIYTSNNLYNHFKGNQNWALYGDKVVNKDEDSGSIDNFLYKTSSTNAEVVKIVKGEPIDATTYTSFIRPNVFRDYTNDIKLNANYATAIQNSVFYNATNVTLNATRATYIGNESFRNTSKVILNAPNVTCVGSYAFGNAINAQLNLCNLQTSSANMCVNANISGSNFSNIKDIGVCSFYNTKGWNGGLTGLNYVGGSAFENSNIQSVGFTANAYIDHYAFQNCKSLNSVDFANIRYLGDYAFADCTALPNPGLLTLNYIGSNCFNNIVISQAFVLRINAFNLNQTWINAVTHSDSPFKYYNISFATQGLYVGVNAFTRATLNLQSVSGGYIKYVGDNAFNNCSRSGSTPAVNFPGPPPANQDSIYIDDNAFRYCHIFSNIGCSSGLLYTEHLGSNAFYFTQANIKLYHTENVSTVLGFYSGIKTTNVFNSVTNVTVFFPDQIRRFGYKTFYNCANVTLVEGGLRANAFNVDTNNSFSKCTVNILLNSAHANYLKGNATARNAYINSIKNNSTNCTVTGYNVSTNEKIF